jgi:hypothetical protein
LRHRNGSCHDGAFRYLTRLDAAEQDPLVHVALFGGRGADGATLDTTAITINRVVDGKIAAERGEGAEIYDSRSIVWTRS